MAFFDIDFPRNVAAGVQGGPERRVDVVPLGSGREERNARWANSRRRFSAGLGIRDADDLAAVLALWEEVGGPFHSFRFRDWSDFKSGLPSAAPAATDQALGVGDGVQTAFQLVKSYGTVQPWARRITKPVAGSVRVALGGVEVGAGWSVDHLTGVVSFLAPPAAGVAVSAGFLFDVPVRFEEQSLAVDMAFFSDARGGAGSIPSIPLIEVDE
ncbi:MAG: TIGR02217 family protein [Alphaproteobacteria bacterium HGW-Alphaproteobacteria-5]|nr:MAG: TIGR02217 family protein [Alphaproteobacteria bacterium HGW-Alphaproteobacteria-5]